MPEDSKDIEEKVIKDMSDKYNDDISNIQEQIDLLKQQILTNPEFIINLNERIQALYIKLFQQKLKPDEITLQNKFKKAISKVRVFGYKRILDEYGNITNQRLIYQGKFNRQKYLLEKREIHLNKILGRLGLTSKGRKEKRRVV